MDKLDGIKQFFLRNKIIAIIVFLCILVIGIASLKDSILSLFKEEKNIVVVKDTITVRTTDTVYVKIVENPSVQENKIENEVFITDTIKIAKKIEFAELIGKFIPNDDYCMDWSTESDNTAITWISDPFDDIDQQIIKDYSYTRTGYCILTFNGKDIYKTLRKRSKSGLWKITLCGARVGVLKVIIENENLANIDPGLTAKLLKTHCKITEIADGIDTTETYFPFGTKYNVQFSNKRKIKLYESHSCGSGGCGLFIELIL